MSKTTKVMDLLGVYECVLHHGNPTQPLRLYHKSTDFNQDGWRKSHRKLIGKYQTMNAVLADILDSMNNNTFWRGSWKGGAV